MGKGSRQTVEGRGHEPRCQSPRSCKSRKGPPPAPPGGLPRPHRGLCPARGPTGPGGNTSCGFKPPRRCPSAAATRAIDPPPGKAQVTARRARRGEAPEPAPGAQGGSTGDLASEGGGPSSGPLCWGSPVPSRLTSPRVTLRTGYVPSISTRRPESRPQGASGPFCGLSAWSSCPDLFPSRAVSSVPCGEHVRAWARLSRPLGVVRVGEPGGIAALTHVRGLTAVSQPQPWQLALGLTATPRPRPCRARLVLARHLVLRSEHDLPSEGLMFAP